MITLFRKIMLVATLAISTLHLTGCATVDQKPATVFVPVVAPKAVLPARPKLAIAGLDESSTDDLVIKAYAESVLQLTGYATELEELLK